MMTTLYERLERLPNVHSAETFIQRIDETYKLLIIVIADLRKTRDQLASLHKK